MNEEIIERLHEFKDWVSQKVKTKVVILDNKLPEVDCFSIILNKDSFSLYRGHENLNHASEEFYSSIVSKLDELNLLSSIKTIDIPLNNDALDRLESMVLVDEIYLHHTVNNIDISNNTSIHTITFTLNENTSIIFPKSIKTARVTIESFDFPENCLKSLFDHTHLTNLTIFQLGKRVNFDLSTYNLNNITNLTIACSRDCDIYIGTNLPVLKTLSVHGPFGSERPCNLYVSLPEQLTDFHLMDCNVPVKAFYEKCKNISSLVIIDSNIDSSCINEILTNNAVTEIHITDTNFSEIAHLNWDLSKTNKLALQSCKFNNLNFLKNALVLEELIISNCGLKSFPQSLPNTLSKIKLRYNEGMTELPSCLPEKITEIDVECCGIVNVPKYYLSNFSVNAERTTPYNETSNSATLNIYDNPIENPPLEILKGSNENIKSYVESMIGEPKVLNEAKIIFVGDGSVGKTSLMKRLVRDEFDATESQTDGIEIEPFVVDLGAEGTVNATIWDFGGQQILQATHQLFLSKRSIYVLVVEDRKNDKHKDQDIEQWLTQVNSLGGRPPILVVKNKIDENPHSDIQTQKLKNKFPNIIGFFEVSCQQRQGLDKLHSALSECIRTLPMRKIALPKNWLDVKLQLKEQASNFDLLYLNTYQDICEQNGISDKYAKDTLLRLLHDLGAVIAFEELKSHNTAILNPHWITEGIYAIIRSEVLAENNGVITLSGAQTALDNYSEHNRFDDKASYIIDAMRNFELCHATEETNTYLIPALLPPQINLSQSWENEYAKHQESIVFLFRFEHLLPPPLLPMFLVKMHSYIVGEQRWRSGAIISPTHLDAKALVDADNVTREIKLTIIGDERRDLLVLLRAEINNIAKRLADINEIGLQEHVVLGDSNETIGYDELIGLKQMGVSDYPIGRLGRRFSVSSLLGEIEAPADTEKALKVLMKSSKNGNGLINLNMIQRNENSATGGNANNTVTANNSNVNTNHNTATSSVDIKQEFKAFKGQSEFVLEDIRDEIDNLTSADRQLKDYATQECEKVEKAISELTNNVDSQETADENLRHFSRIQNFLDGALKKTNSVGKVIDQAGNIYSEVEKLAVKFNDIAGKFAMPTVALLGLGG
ncbi:GTP-binding protein [Vibrio parahaemolyticus]